MVCSECKANNAEGQKFCGECGAKLEKPKPVIESVEPPKAATPAFFESASEESSRSAKPKKEQPPKPKREPLSTRAKLIIGGTVTALIVFVGIAQSMAAAEYAKYMHVDFNKTVDMFEYVSKDVIDAKLKSECKSPGIYPPVAEVRKVKKHVQLLQNAVNKGARSSAKIVLADWISESNSSYEDPAYLIAYKANWTLRKELSKDKRFKKDGIYQWVEFWQYDLAEEAAKVCKIPYEKRQLWYDLTSQYDDLVTQAQSLAASVPWYPEGYSAWSGDSSIAWQWYHSYCNLGDSCWHVKVITQSGCSSLYGELNIKDSSGSVIDYTNDLTGALGAYDTAILEFSTYSDYADTGSLTELNCHI
jgi:hypothetical protein